MTGTKRAWCGAALLCLLTLACWLGALSISSWLTGEYDGLSARFPEPAVAQKELARSIAETPGDEFACQAAWSSGQKLQTASTELGTQAQLRVILAYGDLRAIAPMHLLAGSFPVGDDTEGCLLDEASARQLFHSTGAIGATVTLGKSRYIVRGVVEAYEPMLVARSGNATYENLEFSAANLPAAKQLVETFLYRCNAPKTYTLIESGLLCRIQRGIVWLCPCVFCVAGAIAQFRSARSRKDRANAAVPRYLASAVLLAVAITILGATFYWPQSFLPTKWSNFTFWSDFAEGWKALFKAISLLTPHPKEIQLFSALRWCAVLELTALLAGGWGIASFRRIHGASRSKRTDGMV